MNYGFSSAKFTNKYNVSSGSGKRDGILLAFQATLLPEIPTTLSHPESRLIEIMPIVEASRCVLCQRIYVEGRGGVCMACRQAKRKGSTKRRPAGIPCDCGERAVIVVLVRVGTEVDGISTMRMPLCRACLEIEKEISRDLHTYKMQTTEIDESRE